MPTAPNLAAIKAYLGVETSWTDAQVLSALTAETSAQQRRCRFPVELAGALPYPDDLAEALCRRVAVNLALRSLPLGIQTAMSEMNASQSRVGGRDPEVQRLEAPWRRHHVG